MTTSSRPHLAKLQNTPASPFLRASARAGRGLAAWGGQLVLGLALATTGMDATLIESDNPEPGFAAPAKLGDDELIIEEVFQSHLPTTLAKYGLRLSVNPHLGDWQRKDHMRLTTTLRYGLTRNCEVSAGSNLYFSHGNGDIRAFEDYGAANLKLGFKLNLGQPLRAGWETAVGASYEFPTGHPPPEMTDGLRHLRPYASFSHRLASHPEWRIFVGFRLDNLSKTSLPGEFAKNSFRESSTGITGGFVVDRGNLHYTFEASWDTTRWIGHSAEDIYSIRPGVLWEIPQRRDRRLKSNWMVGVSLNDTYGPGGNSMGASFKLRYNRDLKERSRRPLAIPSP